MYTYIHTHTIVDIQEMHYLLLMIMHEDMVNDLTNYFKTPEVLHIQISKKTNILIFFLLLHFFDFVSVISRSRT